MIVYEHNAKINLVLNVIKMRMSEVKNPLPEPASLEDFGSTLTKYFHVALAMNYFPENSEISIEELADTAQVHWNTAKKAMMFFGAVKPIIPDFKIESNSKIRIKKKPEAMLVLDAIFLSLEFKITAKMLLEKLTSKERGQDITTLTRFLNHEELDYLPMLTQKGLVNTEEGFFYLSDKGSLVGNIGVKKIADIGIPLPWEEKANFQEINLKVRIKKPKQKRKVTRNWVIKPRMNKELIYAV